MRARLHAFLVFRSPTAHSAYVNVVRPALLWGSLAASVYSMWELGPGTRYGRAVIGLVFPLLLVVTRLVRRAHWRTSLNHALAFSIPACTLRLFCDFLGFGTGPMPDHPMQRLSALLDAIAELLRETSITAGLGILALLFTYSSSWTASERTAFLSTTFVVFLALLSVTVVCAGIFHISTGIALESMALHLLP